MKEYSMRDRGLTRRAAMSLAAAGAASAAFGIRPSFAAEKVRIGLATKTWWPTIVAETAEAQGLFKKAGIDAELTVYRSGGEAYEAIAAGASDLTILNVGLSGTGRRRGVNTKMVALAASINTGWKLVVSKASPIKSISELAGKKVAITSAGSLSDFLGLWTRSNYKIAFTSVPVGGGGLVPNLIAGNVDAAIVYSPLSFQLLQNDQVREIVDYASVVPPSLAQAWGASDEVLKTRKPAIEAALRAIYGSVHYLQSNPAAAIQIIAKANAIAEPVAKQEYEETFLKLSKDGAFTLDLTNKALELAKIGGFENLAPAEEIVDFGFTPVKI